MFRPDTELFVTQQKEGQVPEPLILSNDSPFFAELQRKNNLTIEIVKFGQLILSSFEKKNII